MADEQRLKPLGKIVLFLFIIGCFAGAYYLFPKKGAPSAGAKPIDSGSSSSGGIFSRNVSAEIGVIGLAMKRGPADAIERDQNAEVAQAIGELLAIEQAHQA